MSIRRRDSAPESGTKIIFPFDEGSGNTLSSTDGGTVMNKTSTLSWGTDPTEGSYLNWVNENNTNRYINANITLGTNYSIKFRMYVYSNPFGSGTDAFRTVMIENENTGGVNLFTSTRARVGTTPISNTNAFSLNTWFDLEIVRDGETYSTYVNGVLEGSGTVPLASSSNVTILKRIGRNHNSSFPENFRGRIAWIEISLP